MLAIMMMAFLLPVVGASLCASATGWSASRAHAAAPATLAA